MAERAVEHNVARYLRAHAIATPDAPALMVPEKPWRVDRLQWTCSSFSELDQRSDAIAELLQRAGVKQGERAVVLVPPSLELYATLFGLFKLGVIPVLLDPGMGARALLSCIKRTAPTVMVADPRVHALSSVVRRPFSTVRIRVTAGRRWFWGGVSLRAASWNDPEPRPLTAVAKEDTAAILFTSGSTGPAKGVLTRHGMLSSQVEALQEMFDFQPGWTDLQAFAGFALFDICLGMCAALAPMNLSRPASADPETMLAAHAALKPEVAFGSPIVWQRMSRLGAPGETPLSHLRVPLTVGAPIPAYLHHRLRAMMGEGREIYTPYGATESLPVTWIGTEEILSDTWPKTAQGHGTCVGRLAPSIRVRIITIGDEPIASWHDDLEMEAGAIGEVIVSGPQASAAYADAPEANAKSKIQEGDTVWHRMGDLGYLDAKGRLWFCGRKAHRLETESGMIPAVPVEGIFNEHPAIFRSACVGVGPRGAQRPVLVVELEPGTTWRAEMQDELLAMTAGTRFDGLFDRVLVHDGFPTDARHNSKIRREDIAPWAAAQLGVQ
jgi:acyl-CoA synthetase (AMP-forming)/AMP-acid ligase II